MDGVRATRRLSALLLLGAIGLCGLVLASLSPSRAGRAGPSWSTGVGAGAVIEAGAAEPDRKSAASAAGAPPDWQLVAKTPGGARAHTAAELTDVLVAEFTKPPRSQNLATVAALRMLLGEKSEAEILEAAAALLECRAGRAALVASTLALGVLRAEGRRITDDEAYAIVGETAARILAESVAEPGDVLLVSIGMPAGRILAAIGSPRAAQVILDCSSGFHGPTTGLLADILNPASVPLLSQAIVSRTEVNQVMIAAALSRTAEGRAELRRLLDPAGGFHWAEHASAKVAAMRILATGFREDRDLSAIDAVLRARPDVLAVVTGAMAQHGKENPLSDAGLLLPTKTEQAAAIVGFLAGQEGSAIEPSLLAILGRFPERIVDPLLPRLEAARPGMRDRVVAARTPAK